jgi:hypothetical protein
VALIAALAAGSLATSAVAADNDGPAPAPPCFDLAIVGRLVKQTYSPLPRDPRAVVLDDRFSLDLAVEQRLAGREPRQRITAQVVMHTEFDKNVRWLLVFLRRLPGGGYSVLGLERDVVRDAAGRFVIPVPRPLSLSSRWYNYIPAGYIGLLRPIRYAPSQTWWLRRKELPTISTCIVADAGDKVICGEPYPDDKNARPDLGAFPWGTMKGDVLVADRGLFVTDIAKANAGRRCPLSRSASLARGR